MMIVIRVLLFVLLSCSSAFASPFMVCDPSPQVIGGGYEILEITKTYPEGRLAYSSNNEADGSIKMDLNAVPIGTHNWKIRYTLNNDVSVYISCTLVVTSLYYTSDVKTYKYYSLSKSWVLKVLK